MSGLKILLIDQLDISRKAFGRLLEKKGYEVIAIDSGQTAMALSEFFKPEVVIFSCSITGVDRVQCCEALININPVLKIIFTGTSNDIHLLNQIYNPAGKIFLKKPFSGEELIKAVDLCVEKSNCTIK